MYNLGLEVLQPRMGEIPEDWSMEQFYEITNELDRGLDALTNLVAIRNSMIKYGKTPQLTHLVGGSLEEAGITFSTEGLWDSIKAFFVWIKEKIVAAWKWFWGLFGFYKDDVNKAKEVVDAAKEVVNAKDPEQKRGLKQKAKDKIKAFAGRLFKTGSKESYDFSAESISGGNITINMPDPKKLALMADTLEKAQDSWNDLINKIGLKNIPTEEQLQQATSLYQQIMTHLSEINNPEFFNPIQIELSENRVVDSLKDAFSEYVEVKSLMEDFKTQIETLKIQTDEAEKSLTKDPNNEEFKRSVEYLKMSCKLNSELLKLMTKSFKIGKQVLANCAMALVDA